MPDAIVEKLWKVVDCRDRSLSRAHELIAQQLSEKEKEIQRMANALIDKEDEIRQLADVASERLELINSQHAELEAVRRSSEYRFGYLVLNPWQILKKWLFGNTGFR